MDAGFSLLILTAASVALIHTLTGPDHYLPFIVISRAKNWSLSRTLWFTVLCGIGHVGSSIMLGFVGIAFGIALQKLVFLEAWRGSIISFAFTAFGLLYLVWAIVRIKRNQPHEHLHVHPDGHTHTHEHTHHGLHIHMHEKEKGINLTPWILFTIFIFGPCEPLIPIVMYPAAKHQYAELVIVTAVFSLITIFTMVTIVSVTFFGFQVLPYKFLEKYNHILAATTIFLCGIGMSVLGL